MTRFLENIRQRKKKNIKDNLLTYLLRLGANPSHFDNFWQWLSRSQDQSSVNATLQLFACWYLALGYLHMLFSFSLILPNLMMVATKSSLMKAPLDGWHSGPTASVFLPLFFEKPLVGHHKVLHLSYDLTKRHLGPLWEAWCKSHRCFFIMIL